MNEIAEFLSHLFSPASWPARWHCGLWTPFHGWLYIISNLLIAAAYFSIPVILYYIIIKTKNKLPFQRVYWLFLFFIMACGFTHVFDALMFWYPVYRVSAVVLFITALVSGAAVVALYKIVPAALTLKSPLELEKIIVERTKELEEANRSLLKTNTQLLATQKISEKLLQQKDEFISLAGHEMKTPLTSVKGYIELLLLSLNDQTPTALYASKANEAVHRLHNLISQLLDASRLQNGLLTYNIALFDLNKILDEAVEGIQHTTKTHTIKKKGAVTQKITGDKNRLQQVIINLLSNAVKFSPNADKVLVNMEEREGRIQVSVQDFGVGMSGEHLNKIFERYYRVQEDGIQFQGLGIGLYISYCIIQKHGGKMWLKSEAGKGSTFFFTVPFNFY